MTVTAHSHSRAVVRYSWFHVTERVYPQLVDALKLLPAKNAIIDGEIAALNQHGKSSFQLLQAFGKSKETPLIYCAFDLLELEGNDLRNRPLVERRKRLAKLLEKAPDNIRFSEELRGNRDRLLEVAHKFQLEGLVAKRPNSFYESGRRSGAWLKVNLTQQQEFVIGGYTQPEESPNISARCWLVTIKRIDWFLPVESAPDFLTNS